MRRMTTRRGRTASERRGAQGHEEVSESDVGNNDTSCEKQTNNPFFVLSFLHSHHLLSSQFIWLCVVGVDFIKSS